MAAVVGARGCALPFLNLSNPDLLISFPRDLS